MIQLCDISEGRGFDWGGEHGKVKNDVRFYNIL